MKAERERGKSRNSEINRENGETDKCVGKGIELGAEIIKKDRNTVTEI
jgi:hypothetical protein